MSMIDRPSGPPNDWIVTAEGWRNRRRRLRRRRGQRLKESYLQTRRAGFTDITVVE